jgi:hypothetical protein
MLDSVVKLDLCTDMTNMETGVDSSRLCGYLHGQSPQSMVWSFDMDNLMMVSCAEVSTGICSTVYNAGGGTTGQTTVRMVVAASLRGLTTASGSSSSRRRLLQQEEEEAAQVHTDSYAAEMELSPALTHELLVAPGWNTSAQPCRGLVQAYLEEHGGQLGVLETIELHRCVFWRFVGRRALERNNLTGGEHEPFLVSMDDFINAIMSPNGFAWALFHHPGVFGSALMYHPWMRPMRALGVMIANQLEHLQWVREIDYDVHEALFGGDDFVVEHPGQQPAQRMEEVAVRRLPKLPDKGGREGERQTPRGRRLLQVSSVVDTVKDVAQYSGQIIQGAADGSKPLVSTRVAGAWSTASFAWPPVYNYAGQTCPVALSALHLARQAVMVVSMYFESFGMPRPPIDRSLRANLPDFSAWVSGVYTQVARANVTQTSWASWVFHKGLDVAGIRPEHLVGFFTLDRKWTLSWILETSIKCDLASTVTCSRHDKDLIMSSVVFLLGYMLVVRPVCDAFGLGFLPIMYILSYPGFVMWYVFGMPISCFPMIPTCLMSDIIATVETLVPEAIVFPASLRCDEVDAVAHPLNQTCLRSCETLRFSGWSDPLAFAVCDTDLATCRYLASFNGATGLAFFDTLVWLPFRDSLQYFEAIVASSAEHLAGHRLCTWVSFVTAVPVLGLLGLCVVAATAVVSAALELIPSVVAFIGQLYIFFTAGG